MIIILRSKLAHFIAVAGLASAPMIASGILQAHAGEEVLHAFRGGKDGAFPRGALIASGAGDLYGATEAGGTGTGCHGNSGCGTLFKLSKSGGETLLYSFQGGNDGIGPYGPLLMDGSGNLYGTTEGGAGNGCAGYGCGTVFKYAPDGAETVLHAFQGGSDGTYPEGGLIADGNGNLYGVTGAGGNYNGSDCSQAGCGTVFEIEPNGSKIILYSFLGGSDGAFPIGSLIADTSGNFYGTTQTGGDATCNPAGCGTVFKLTPGGTETVLHAFQGGDDGMFPEAGLIADGAGNLYGTTPFDGAGGGGTVFKVSPGGAETVLYTFKGGSDGATPKAGVILDKKGNLYGTTYAGGSGAGCKESGGCGVVFEVTRDGTEIVLHAFDRKTYQHQGLNPMGGLLLGQHGDLYGTTSAGGHHNNGVVFELKK